MFQSTLTCAKRSRAARSNIIASEAFWAAPSPKPKIRGIFLMRDKNGRPKFDHPMSEYPLDAQEAFRSYMTEAEIEEFFGK